ncbi:galanin receptor type 1 isoform X1 [Nothobranchius furzeri]|uniref:Galanin receptor type 1-like n=2 Tax=Nothobranchius furzeri TaxID=105023 RepID=A0A8C6LAT4_NOTFU|nr:galanin receptor type 1 isoform X2 [Nothobranchius furzeri]XP_015812843.1 galanin receptor type 1 isoform X2 [Nothobranchius furzeri]XP_054589498.1 galanin receptor type 1 isoform X2 [Nothobranchius furzeri]XP_054589559.1 galanin receptor type 1 isoform X2 [Nothobranchius furzeri]XP_054589584.1 galanin receptor type 1 isoform X2 [Nothobranchius furzeri]KAF7222907.1 transcript variant X2 [Nothobranchius furzeri]KAF7222909.1 transcript variant X1 [Nothobranchius furzeri]
MVSGGLLPGAGHRSQLPGAMPAIVNLFFNVVSTNTTISFNVVLPMMSLVSLVAGVTGHLLLWLVLVRNPRSRTKPSSILLLNLSLADLGALLTLPCVLLSASVQNWQLGGGTCVLLGFMTSVAVGVEIFSLAALAVLRYRIVAPRIRPPANMTQVLCTVVAIWLVSIAMAVPKVTYINFDGGCTWSVGWEEWLFFLVPALLVYYVAPLLCIAINCGLIISHLHSCRGTLIADRRNKKATALLVGSTLVFAVSWLPYYALEFVNVLSPHVSSAASPASNIKLRLSSPLSPMQSSDTSPASGGGTLTKVTLLWEMASLMAILLVCMAPCWNPPLYFLLSRPAVRQLRALLPSFLRERLLRKPVQRWRVTPAHPPCLQRPQAPPVSFTHQSLTCRLTQ